MEKQFFKIRVNNLSGKNITFRLEPWADEKELLANESVIVDSRGPVEGLIEIEYYEQEIVIYGWTGSICEIEGT